MNGNSAVEWTADMVNGLPYYSNLNNDGNLDNYQSTGVFTIHNASNSPTGTWGTLFVDWNAGTKYQMFIPDGGGPSAIWKRQFDANTGTFQAWDSTDDIYVGSSAPSCNNAKLWIVP